MEFVKDFHGQKMIETIDIIHINVISSTPFVETQASNGTISSRNNRGLTDKETINAQIYFLKPWVQGRFNMI